MSRYFIEVAYDGTRYSGFQIQQNANTIQAEIEKALKIFFRETFVLTGSSRTDGGVHALQNYFHTNSECDFKEDCLYHLNAILPDDIIVRNIHKVDSDAHCRFDAISRQYRYYIYTYKNPFKRTTAFFYPYSIDLNLLNEAAAIILATTHFESFAKKNSQAHTYNCTIQESKWTWENDTLIYTVKANRFLRGMVKGLVGTMLQVGTRKISADEFRDIISSANNQRADFSVPSHGLFLERVSFPFEL